MYRFQFKGRWEKKSGNFSLIIPFMDKSSGISTLKIMEFRSVNEIFAELLDNTRTVEK